MTDLVGEPQESTFAFVYPLLESNRCTSFDDSQICRTYTWVYIFGREKYWFYVLILPTIYTSGPTWSAYNRKGRRKGSWIAAQSAVRPAVHARTTYSDTESARKARFQCVITSWFFYQASSSQQWQKQTRLVPVCVEAPLCCSPMHFVSRFENALRLFSRPRRGARLAICCRVFYYILFLTTQTLAIFICIHR